MAGTDSGKRRAGGAAGPAVILVNPQLSQNIGTAARAMLNCGLTDLRLVAPRDPWPDASRARSMVNDDLSLAEVLIRIPLNPGFSSLNLAQAVLLVGYEWFTAADRTPGREDRYGQSPPADKDKLLNFFLMLEKELDECGFLRVPDKRPSMVRNIRNMFQRAGLSEQELRTLHGMIACLTDWRAGTDELGEPVRMRRMRKGKTPVR